VRNLLVLLTKGEITARSFHTWEKPNLPLLGYKEYNLSSAVARLQGHE
jgi:hypothetical protein